MRLNVVKVIRRSVALFAHHPLGLLWVLIQTFVVMLFSLGTWAGPMLVGLYAVLIRYVRDGAWQPERLWGRYTFNNLLGGVVFVLVNLAIYLVGVPSLNFHPLLNFAVLFVFSSAVTLLWFYTFQLLSEQDQPWQTAVRQGWRLVLQGGLGQHVGLILILALLSALASSGQNTPLLLQLLVLLIFLVFSVLLQTSAYVMLRDQPK
ncbi:MAG: hypothetical protein SFU83_16485 [Meiothermus sp.]|nr:hypothetical protein [Meiothermus sp.]